MAYPARSRMEDPNASENLSSLRQPVVDQVTVPRASATGGAPKLNQWWMDKERPPLDKIGDRVSQAMPGPWSLETIMRDRKVMVEHLTQVLKDRQQAAGDDAFWERVRLAPDAVAASLVRRTMVLMSGRGPETPSWYNDSRMPEQAWNNVQGSGLYRWLQGIRNLNGRQ